MASGQLFNCSIMCSLVYENNWLFSHTVSNTGQITKTGKTSKSGKLENCQAWKTQSKCQDRREQERQATLQGRGTAETPRSCGAGAGRNCPEWFLNQLSTETVPEEFLCAKAEIDRETELVAEASAPQFQHQPVAATTRAQFTASSRPQFPDVPRP